MILDCVQAFRRCTNQDSLKPAAGKVNSKSKKLSPSAELKLKIHQNHMAVFNYIQELRKFGKRYWYIVVPLHTILSVTYVGIFYLASRKTRNVLVWLSIYKPDVQQSEFLPKFPKKTLEDIAITLVLYKIATPVRFATTIIGSRHLVRFLRNRNIISKE